MLYAAGRRKNTNALTPTKKTRIKNNKNNRSTTSTSKSKLARELGVLTCRSRPPLPPWRRPAAPRLGTPGGALARSRPALGPCLPRSAGTMASPSRSPVAIAFDVDVDVDVDVRCCFCFLLLVVRAFAIGGCGLCF